jgi:hypothetical protein
MTRRQRAGGSGSVRWLWLFALVLAWRTLQPAHAASAPDCKPAGGASFICGVTNVEDFAPIPHTRWVIGSDLSAAAGTLFLFDTGLHAATAVSPAAFIIQPDLKTYPDCPGPPDPVKFSPHGLDLTRAVGAHPRLYVVNHGGRESVEVLIVDLTRLVPAFTWIGCLIAPPGFWPDAVASLPDGGLVVTSLWDPGDADRVAKLSAGQPVGGLDEWHPGKGWTPVSGGAGLSGPNGVIVSADGRDIYVAAWSGKQLAHIPRGPAEPKVVTVLTGILTDNVRWSPDDSAIYVGGQDASVQQVLDCFDSNAVNCDIKTKVYRADPKTLKLTELVKSGVYGVFGAGTGAVRIGQELWISSFRADRIAIFPVK